MPANTLPGNEAALPMQSQSGMSLLELTLVVAILGVLALIAIPQVSNPDPGQLDLAAEIQDSGRFLLIKAIFLQNSG